MTVKLFTKLDVVERHESELLAEMLRWPLMQEVVTELGLELMGLRWNPFCHECMAEPIPACCGSMGYKRGKLHRNAIWEVTKTREVDRSSFQEREELHYETVPMVEYLIAGFASPRSIYLATKLADGKLLHPIGDTYPRLGYLLFACSMRDGHLRVTGPSRRAEHPAGWPS